MEPITFELDGTPVVYRPTATMLNRSDDGTRMQIVLEDVTAETRRHDLMEAYAAHVVSGQEEERRHIAQEIHDGPVQTLIHLCRQIDLASSRAGIDPERAHEICGSPDHRRGHSGRASLDRQGPAAIDPRRPGLGRLDRPGPLRGRTNGNNFETSFAVAGTERRLGSHGRAGTLPHRPGGDIEHRAACGRPSRRCRARLRGVRAAAPGKGRRGRVRSPGQRRRNRHQLAGPAGDDRARPI